MLAASSYFLAEVTRGAQSQRLRFGWRMDVRNISAVRSSADVAGSAI